MKIYVSFFLFLGPSLLAQSQQPNASFRLAPSYFVANSASQKSGKRMVDNPEVIAFLPTQGGRVLFTSSGAYFSVGAQAHASRKSPEHVVLKAGFAPSHAKRRGITARLGELTSAKVNYLIGPRTDWQPALPTFREITYDQVWEGISLQVRGYMDHLEYRLMLDPGSEPSEILLETGAEALVASPNGAMVAQLGPGALNFQRPTAYQLIGGERREVVVAYAPAEQGRFSFSLGTYDPKHSLIIEPSFTWSTFLGGPGSNHGEANGRLLLDDEGNAYITGISSAFPTTPGVYSEQSFDNDAVIAKINSSGTAIIFATFLGGHGYDGGTGIALDQNKNIYITGDTDSPDFPTTEGAYQRSLNRSNDVFVSKLNSDGSALMLSTLIGGSDFDLAVNLFVTETGVVYIAGTTYSEDFPTTQGAFKTVQSLDHQTDIFVTCLNETLSTLNFSTNIGGYDDDSAQDFAVDSSGCVYVTGYSFSPNFPTTEGAYDRLCQIHDGVVFKLDPTGTMLQYSTFLGGPSRARAYGLALDAGGCVYVTGNAREGFPTTPGVYSGSVRGDDDAFLLKLNASGSDLVYATAFGGSAVDVGREVVIGADGTVYVLGATLSADFPTTLGAYDGTYSGNRDLFVAKFGNDGSQLHYSTYLGGDQDDFSHTFMVDELGQATLFGNTSSSNYPLTAGVIQEQRLGVNDMFLTRLNSEGSALQFSTLLGGPNDTDVLGQAKIAVDDEHAVYVLCTAGASGFPTTPGGYDEQAAGLDVTLTKFTADGSELLFSTYFGGSEREWVAALAVDDSGYAVVAGSTLSDDFPVTVNAFDQTFSDREGFLTKFNSDGSDLVFSTFLGGLDGDFVVDMMLDAYGHAYLLGSTSSVDFPVTPGAYRSSFNSSEAFLVKFNGTGSSIDYATFYSDKNLEPKSLAVDSDSCTYALFSTNQAGQPTTPGAYGQTYNGGSSDIYLVKLDQAGMTAQYATYLGGLGNDSGTALAVDATGATYVLGCSSSVNFPTTLGAFGRNNAGFFDATLTKLDAMGAHLLYSTYIGGNENETPYALQIDPSGAAYVAGTTFSTNFPTTPNGADQTYNSWADVFFCRVNPSGSLLTYSTYVGGHGDEERPDLALDSDIQAYLVSWTSSWELATTSGAYQEQLRGYYDLFIAKFNPCPIVQPGPIDGQIDVCAGETGLIYSVAAVAGASGYTWILPNGATLLAGQNTNQISVDFGSESGQLRVRTETPCGPSPWQSLAITVSPHAQPSAIDGETLLCAEESGILYAIDIVDDAIGYIWTVPEGATITSGQGSAAITVSFGANSGTVSVKAQFTCGYGAPIVLPVQIIQPILLQASPADHTLCLGETLAVGVVAIGDQVDYQWYLDGQPLADNGRISGATQANLTINDLDFTDQGLYTCILGNFCSSITSPSFTLSLNAFDVWVDPPVATQGLMPLTLNAIPICPRSSTRHVWTNLETGEVFSQNPLTMSVTETTEFEVQVTDESGDTAVRSVWVLYPPTGQLDLNGDGHNNIEDLLFALPDWNTASANDLDGDDMITVIDFLYINLGP